MQLAVHALAPDFGVLPMIFLYRLLHDFKIYLPEISGIPQHQRDTQMLLTP